MANQVYANNMEVSCKQGAGKSICAFPDVCFTPPQTPATPPGVPIPYPNTGMDSDATDGSSTVKISGQEVMLKNKSYFKQSTGDEAGCAPKKGIVTSTNKGKVYFNAWSMDVKVEGENVVRHLDMTTHNHNPPPGQTPPWPFLASMEIGSDLCETEKFNEEAACADYKPAGKKDACKDAGLGEPLIQSDVDAVAAGFMDAGAWAEHVSKKADANNKAAQCIQARRCKLVPYDAEKDGVNGCCPSQTPDHVIPKSSFGTWPGYKAGKAPCMCAEGAGNTVGTHGLRHAHHKANGPGEGVMQSFNKEADLCAQGAAEVFKSSGCTEECIKAQLKNGHKGMGNQSTKIEHSPSGSELTKTQINDRIKRRTFSKTSR